ncbi:NRDE family protein [Halomonas alkaliantarctica]|uniref:NRDE family protein n=1 Tax=Halomonas alkaliantarctica TaxID=232346 RepID=A0ABY8LQJ4_9GAMM|nr:NRDE family protein [Halomonas alkaliantarctica]WGI26690.1 NRDE family protein [Halomonas alkaliantarctica]
MCLISFAWQPGTPMPLRLMGNRDEFHARPTAPLGVWKDNPKLFGGRDLEAGGSWLAARRGGIVATLTNVRDLQLSMPPGAPSRGELVANALQCGDIEAWLITLSEGEALRYAGFNLLVATPTRLWHLHRGRNHLALNEVAPGVHGLSNANLNSPWPKLLHVRSALEHTLSQPDPTQTWPTALQRAMQNPQEAAVEELPDTGVGLELERQLSAAFIVGERYGTRATSWLTLDSHGHIEITEQRFGPLGRFEGETTLALPSDSLESTS